MLGSVCVLKNACAKLRKRPVPESSLSPLLIELSWPQNREGKEDKEEHEKDLDEK